VSPVLTLLALAQAAAAPGPALPAPVERLCLLAGPSRSLVAVRVVPRGQGYAVEPVPGEVWPFAGQSLPLAATGRSLNFDGRDEAGQFFASYQLHFASGGGVNLEIVRGSDRLEGLPILGGSCAERGSAAAALYLRQLRDPAAAPRPATEAFRTAPVQASRDCQLVSSAGWVTRFNVEYGEQGENVTIRPADRNLWRAASVRAVRAGMPPLPEPRWVRFAFWFPRTSAEEMPGAINSFWVHVSPDNSQSSVRASFFGYDPAGPVREEDVSGVCTEFKEQGAPS
jgi:hypothetical protein